MKQIAATARRAITPRERITVSDWADQYRYLPAEGGAKEPGPWRTDRTPYLREIMDSMGADSGVESVVVVKGTQVGLTESGINVWAYTACVDPCPVMMMLPTLEVAAYQSRTRITHTIEQTALLRERIKDRRVRDSDNTLYHKSYPGGALLLTGANSARSLRNRSVRMLILDEVDAYESDLDDEGDTVALALRRTDAFGADRRIMMMSTPTIAGVSRIAQEFERSDQRYYYVPCPICGHMQYLRWKDGAWNGPGAWRIVFERDDNHNLISPVQYQCEACNGTFDEAGKNQMLLAGEWRAHNPGHRRRGYHLSALYSPPGFLAWADIVQEFLDAQRSRDHAALKTWKNTRLAEVWDDEVDVAHGQDDAILGQMRARERYGPDVPMPALLVTAGVDVQRDRVEVNVAAWGPGEECWCMEYHVVMGVISEAATQAALDAILFTPRKHASGADIRIACTLMDSGDGVMMQEIYDYVRPRQPRGLFASKGSRFPGKPIIERSKSAIAKGIRLYFIGTDAAKDTIFARLALQRVGQTEGDLYKPLTDQSVTVSPMSIHHRDGAGYDEEYFAQLFAERATREKVGRRYVRVYRQTRPRNEALDCLVLCLAGQKLAAPDWPRLVRALAESRNKAAAVPAPEKKEPVTTQPRHYPRAVRPGRTSWMAASVRGSRWI